MPTDDPADDPTDDPAPGGGSDDDAGTDPDPSFDEARARAKIAKANSEAANLRKRVKDLEAKAAKLDEIEDASKTEAQKLADRLAAAERRAQEAEARVMRAEVAAAKGLTPAQAKRLVGTTVEELEADADDLLATFGGQGDGKPEAGGPPSKPKERLRGGGDPTEEPDELDPAKLAASIPRAPF